MAEYTRTHSIPLDILDDLASRFVINLPFHIKDDLTRIFFQIELAHWFFLDEYVNGSSDEKRKKQLTSCTLREFTEHIFRHLSFLQPLIDDLDELFAEWKEYKIKVPTMGAIMLNEDLSHVLLVQSFYSKTSWGFPKGKVNEAEEAHACAIREVYEETGFDISSRLDPDQVLQATINDQTCWLYLIPGVPSDTVFKPTTKYEIKDFQWYKVSDLPSSKKDQLDPGLLQPRNLYTVMPFIKSLRKWIKGYKAGYLRKNPEKKQSSKGNELKPADPSDFECPKYWSDFHFKRKQVMAQITSTPGWI